MIYKYKSDTKSTFLTNYKAIDNSENKQSYLYLTALQLSNVAAMFIALATSKAN